MVIRKVPPAILPMHPNSMPSAKSFSAIAKKIILALFLANAGGNTQLWQTSDHNYPHHTTYKGSPVVKT
jgi:hypothetical protein